MRWFLERLWMRIRLGGDTARQIEAFINWAATIVQQNDVIRIEFPDYRRSLFFPFPRFFADPPRIAPLKTAPTFIIRQAAVLKPEGKWRTIFSSPLIEILEREDRFEGEMPLRFGLDEKTAARALELARKSLERFFGKTEGALAPQKSIPPRFISKEDVGVALWVQGKLRGSQIVTGTSLVLALQRAARRAARDARFAPLTLDELSETRIEISFISSLKIPLAGAEREANAIYPEKGYLLCDGTREGWYLPEVFNIRRFRNLRHFLGDLADEKAGVSPNHVNKSDIFIFEIWDIIESTEKKPLSLSGPMVLPDPVQSRGQIFSRAADWLLAIQEPSGNFPAVFEPLTNSERTDLVRSAFTAWALAEFGKASGCEAYVESAERVLRYLREHLPETASPNAVLTLIYYGKLLLSLGLTDKATEIGRSVTKRISSLAFQPIPLLQAAGFFHALAPHAPLFQENFLALYSKAKEEFRKAIGRGTFDLASWAEFIAVSFTHEPATYREAVKEVAKHQLENGAFPASPRIRFCYSRGTGKIVEVLAVDPRRNQKAIDAGLGWLQGMQYDEENTFFIPPERRKRVRGGFRHDYHNPEVWIDAAGHILLAGARLFLYRS